MDNLHSGHRMRLKERCLKYGFRSLHDHEKLELLLFNVIPRRDTNPIAHNLLTKFGGSLARVFEASVDELKTVDGIGDNAAFFIHLLPSVAGAYAESKVKKGISLGTARELSNFVNSIFTGKTKETVSVICLDSNKNLIKYDFLEYGTVDEVNISIRKVTEYAIKANAVNIVLAHNHPNGSAMPSRADIDTTKQVEAALQALSLNLVDHIIITNNYCYSMKEMGNI